MSQALKYGLGGVDGKGTTDDGTPWQRRWEEKAPGMEQGSKIAECFEPGEASWEEPMEAAGEGVERC